MTMEEELAVDVLTMAYVGGMPDTYWLTDVRIKRACEVLRVPQEQARALAEEVLGR